MLILIAHTDCFFIMCLAMLDEMISSADDDVLAAKLTDVREIIEGLDEE